MTALLSLLAAKATPYIIGGGAIFAAFVAAYVKGRLSGAKLERQKQAASELAARTEGQKIDDAVAGRSPDDNRGRLSKWSPKP